MEHIFQIPSFSMLDILYWNVLGKKMTSVQFFNCITVSTTSHLFILLYKARFCFHIWRCIYNFYKSADSWPRNNKVYDEKLTITNCKLSQKSIKRNSNSKQSNTDLQIDRGKIRCLGGVIILCWPVTPGHNPSRNI